MTNVHPQNPRTMKKTPILNKTGTTRRNSKKRNWRTMMWRRERRKME